MLAPHAVDIAVTISSLIAWLCFTFAEPFDDIFLFVKWSCALVSGNTNKSLRPKDRPTDRPSEWIPAHSLNSYFAFCKIVVKNECWIFAHWPLRVIWHQEWQECNLSFMFTQIASLKLRSSAVLKTLSLQTYRSKLGIVTTTAAPVVNLSVTRVNAFAWYFGSSVIDWKSFFGGDFYEENTQWPSMAARVF